MPTQLPIKWVLGLKWLEAEADHLTLTTAKDKKMWISPLLIYLCGIVLN
jgi:hypothetical protein